jgi:hypothetical protein
VGVIACMGMQSCAFGRPFEAVGAFFNRSACAGAAGGEDPYADEPGCSTRKGLRELTCIPGG